MLSNTIYRVYKVQAKTIQKLTGKLGQKLRDLKDDVDAEESKKATDPTSRTIRRLFKLVKAIITSSYNLIWNNYIFTLSLSFLFTQWLNTIIFHKL